MGLLNIEPEIVHISRKANTQFQNGNVTDGRSLLLQIFQLIKNDPSQLKSINDLETIGKSFLLMLSEKLSDDLDNLQIISGISYLCISKAIEENKNDINLIKDRVLISEIGHDSFIFTLIKALNLNYDAFNVMGEMALSDARDAIYKMEISDIESYPQLCENSEYFKDLKDEFDEMIDEESFLPEKTKEEIIESGKEIHKKLLKYLTKKVFEEEDIEF